MKWLDHRRLIFLDESGFKLAQDRRYGWAPSGEKPVLRGTACAQGFTLIGAIGLDGVRALRIQKEAANKDNFLDYVEQDLIPTLRRGDIVCMDQLQVHKNPAVFAALRRIGTFVLFLPTYSPEFNAIEAIWSWIKGQLTQNVPLEMAVLMAEVRKLWSQVSAELCRACIEHCGYTFEVQEA